MKRRKSSQQGLKLRNWNFHTMVSQRQNLLLRLLCTNKIKNKQKKIEPTCIFFLLRKTFLKTTFPLICYAVKLHPEVTMSWTSAQIHISREHVLNLPRPISPFSGFQQRDRSSRRTHQYFKTDLNISENNLTYHTCGKTGFTFGVRSTFVRHWNGASTECARSFTQPTLKTEHTHL